MSNFGKRNLHIKCFCGLNIQNALRKNVENLYCNLRSEYWQCLTVCLLSERLPTAVEKLVNLANHQGILGWSQVG